MDSERALRELRKTIEELTETFNNTLARKNSRLENFDISSTGYEDRAMFERIRDYGVNPNNPDELRQMISNLNGVIRDLREKRDDLREAIARRRDERPILRGIRSSFENLDSSVNISEEERDDRKASYNTARHRAGRANNPDILIRNLNRQLREFAFDRKAAVAMSEIMQNPELRDSYINLLDMNTRLEEEEHYREEQSRLTAKYNELCKAYMAFEKLERGMANPSITPQHRLVMGRDRQDAIRRIEAAMSASPDDIGRIDDILGEETERATVDIKDIMPALRKEIEDVAFERNALNGIVDDRVLQRDKFDIERVDLQKQLKDSFGETDLAKRKDKQKKLAKTKELQEYLQLLEIKNMISELNSKIAELQTLESELASLQSQIPSPYDPNDSDHVAKKEAADRKLAERDRKKSEVTKLKKEIFDKVSPMKMKGLTKLQLSDLDDPNKIDKIGKGLDSKIRSAEKEATDRRKKALDRYDIRAKKSDQTKDLLEKVDVKVRTIRSKYNTRHAIQTLNGQEQAEREANTEHQVTGSPDVNAPRTNPVNPGNPGMPQRTPGGVVPPLFGNTGRATNGQAQTQTHIPSGRGQVTGVPVGVPGVSGTPATPTTVSPDVNAPQVEEGFRPAEYKYRYLGYQKKIGEVPVQYDLQSQLDELGKQKVEAGKVYRYEKAGDRLLYLEEDLSIYLSNPKAKLNKVLDELRDRLEDEFASKEEMKEFLAQDDKEELRDLISKNPIVRMRARREFMRELEKSGGQLQFANMAIALNSEATPEKINEVIGRKSQPYTRDSDMRKYVRMKDKSRFFGLMHTQKGEVDIPKIMQLTQRAERAEARGDRSALQVRTQTDGMLRPFEISDEEIGGKKERTQDPNRDPQRNQGRGRRNGRGRSAPGGRG